MTEATFLPIESFAVFDEFDRDVTERGPGISFTGLQSSSYEELLSQLKPLDLLFFKGTDLVSRLISQLEKEHLGCGDVSHVGLLVNKDILPLDFLQADTWYVLESTFTSTPGSLSDHLGLATPGIDAKTGIGKLGVQIRELRVVLTSYLKPRSNGIQPVVAWGSLVKNPWQQAKRREKLRTCFTDLFNQYYGRTYAISLLGLMAALYPGLRKPRDLVQLVEKKAMSFLHMLHIYKGSMGPSGWQFCSQLIGNIYQGLEILPGNVDCRDIVPVDFLGWSQDDIPALVKSPILFLSPTARAIIRKNRGLPRYLSPSRGDEPQKRALLIGINYYGSRFALGGCINDAQAVKQMLLEHYGYREENIVLMTDETSVKPNKENIMRGFAWLLSGAHKEVFERGGRMPPLPAASQLYCHYSGHGSQVRAKHDKYEGDGMDETICPIDWESNGMIIDDDIFNHLAKPVPKDCKLYACIDACHSQTSFDLAYTVAYQPGSFSLSRLDGYPETQAEVIVLTGCRDNQVSADISYRTEDGHLLAEGALTYGYLSVLKERAYKASCRDVLAMAGNFIKQKNLSQQTPCLSSGRNDGVLDWTWLS
jgi:hypothetical protein